MHAASLGEYLQGLPVLQSLEEKFPEDKVLVSFFSPSGYTQAQKTAPSHYELIYLPFDKEKELRKMLAPLDIRMFLLVRYDYWYHLLSVLKEKAVPIYVIAAYFYPKQFFFKFYGTWFRKVLSRTVTWFFHQNEASCTLARNAGLTQSSVCGDTRFDTVRKISEDTADIDLLKKFINDKQTILFGSCWEQEVSMAESILARNADVNVILAPHSMRKLSGFKKLFPNVLFYSKLEKGDYSDFDLYSSRVMVIDRIGLLSRLYRMADIAVVGGGFHRKGLHNTLEAAVYGVPVFFGNKYKKNPEADGLIDAQGGKSFSEAYYAAEFILALLKEPELIAEMGRRAAEYVHKQPDSAACIVQKICKDLE